MNAGFVTAPRSSAAAASHPWPYLPASVSASQDVAAVVALATSSSALRAGPVEARTKTNANPGSSFLSIADSCWLAAEPQHVAHVVEAGLAADDPEGGAHGADGEGVAGARAVGDLEAIAVPQEEHGVVADDVAAAQGLDADLARAARADVAVAGVAGRRRQVAAGRVGQLLGQPERGARRCVLLSAVVGLDDLDVVVRSER